MKPFKIGVIVDSFRLGFEKGVKKAAELGVDGIQFYPFWNDLTTDTEILDRIRWAKELIKENGLEVSAVCGDIGCLCVPEENKERIKRSIRIMQFSKEIGAEIVTTHIGPIPPDRNHPRWQVMKDACRQLGEFADSIGMKFAIETGPEPAKLLAEFLDELDCNGMAVNFDPANLAMCVGEVPSELCKALAKYIVHTHAKDGIQIQKADPSALYGFPPDGGKWEYNSDDYFKEVPLGQGDVNFPEYLNALYSTGFRGYLTIEREVGENPEADIKQAIDYLNSILAKM